MSGRTGEHVAALYAAGTKGKNFPALVAQLEAVLGAVRGGGLVVERFFSTANYSSEECSKVYELLATAQEPLTSFAGIKDTEVRRAQWGHRSAPWAACVRWGTAAHLQWGQPACARVAARARLGGRGRAS